MKLARLLLKNNAAAIHRARSRRTIPKYPRKTTIKARALYTRRPDEQAV